MKADSNVVAEVGLLVYPECQLAAVHGLTDLFVLAGEWAARMAEHERPPTIRVSHWKVSGPTGPVEKVWDSHSDLPGSSLKQVIAPPSLVLPERLPPMPAAAKWLFERHREGTTLCSVCAGAFVLAETGLLDGRPATTHWAFAKHLATRFPAVQLADDAMIVDDGDLVTAGGMLAWTDLGLLLVERHLGPSVMRATARFLLVEPPRQDQRPFRMFVPRFDHGDKEILRAQHHVHAHVSERHGVAGLAVHVGLGERTFLRRFAKATGLRPTEYLQQVRIAKAREALELTQQTVDNIAWSVGYEDPSAFRKVFRRLTSLSPQDYRERFGKSAR